LSKQEQKQLLKVQRIESGHHFIPQPQISVSSDPKIAKKQLALIRKQIKAQKEDRWLALGKELAVEVVRGGIQAVGSGLRAAGQIGRGLAENPDPVAQGVAIGGAYALFLWFVASNPELAKAFHLDTFAITSPAGQKAAKDIADKANSIVGSYNIISSGDGQYGLQIESVVGFLSVLFPGANVSGTTWFDSPQERDAYHKVITDKLSSLSSLYTFTNVMR
jgi:hypothetical protein